MTTERRPLRIDSTGGSTVRTSWRTLGAVRRCARGSALVTDTIGGRSPRPRCRGGGPPGCRRPRSAGRGRAAGRPRRPRPAGLRRPARPGNGRPPPPAGWRQVHALAGQGADGGDLGEQYTGHRHRGRGQLFGRRHRLLGGQQAHPAQRLEADGTDHDQFLGHRLEQQLGLTGQCRQLRFDTGRGHQLLEGLQPCAALSAEGNGIRLTSIETIDQRMGGALRASPRSEPRPDPSPVDSLSCSWIVTLSNSLDTSRRVVCRLHSDLRCPGGGVRRFLSRITDGPGGPSWSRCDPGRPSRRRGLADNPAAVRVSRRRVPFPALSVTDEFYARVTVPWVTPRSISARTAATNVLRAGGYGRVATTAQIKA